MASDAIIEGLNQGNAHELELVKCMRDGLNQVLDGLEKECHNRRDAIDDLKEQVQQAQQVQQVQHLQQVQQEPLYNQAKAAKLFDALSEDIEHGSKMIDDRLNSRKAAARDRAQADVSVINKLKDDCDAQMAHCLDLTKVHDQLAEIPGVSALLLKLRTMIGDEYKRAKALNKIHDGEHERVIARISESEKAARKAFAQECKAHRKLREHVQKLQNAILHEL